MELTWKDGIHPFSDLYSDIYFAEEDGFTESRYVFLEQNALPARLIESCLRKEIFRIGELGFGTGLNFFATWDLWRKIKRSAVEKSNPQPHDFFLEFISTEKFPLSQPQILKSLERWPQLHELANKFLNVYPAEAPSHSQTLTFEDEQLRLHLLIGDARDSLSKIHQRVDAWYLDGFAPRKNPEMWSLELMRELARLSSPAATFSTYTSAGWVRRNLEAAGFATKKFKGFGRKREMLMGLRKPGFQKNPVKHSQKNTALIIGAGIAGASAASSLARRGWKVKLLEENSQIAEAASRSQAAISLPIISAEPTTLSRFSFAGLKYFLECVDSLVSSATSANTDGRKIFSKTGIIQLAPDDPIKTEKLKKGIAHSAFTSSHVCWISEHEASQIAELNLSRGGFYFPEGGLVDLQRFSQALVAAESQRILTINQTRVHRVERVGSVWQALATDGNVIAEADVAILANAYGASLFEQATWLPLRSVRGQLIFLKPHPKLSALKTVLCANVSITPLVGLQPLAESPKLHSLGSTYDSVDLSKTVRREESEALIAKLKLTLPELKQESLHVASEWVEFRTSVPGQEPVIGPLIDHRDGSPFSGLYITTAFASRGSLYAPIAGEILAAQICEEALPLESDLIDALSPARKNLAPPPGSAHSQDFPNHLETLPG